MTTRRGCRSLTISSRSSGSRRSVPIIRSQIAFARNACGGFRGIRVPSAANTISNAGGEPGVPIAQRELRRIHAVTEVHHHGAGGVKGPCAGRVVGDPGQMHPATAVFADDQRVDTSQDDRVDVQEVHCEDGFGLLGRELFPGGT